MSLYIEAITVRDEVDVTDLGTRAYYRSGDGVIIRRERDSVIVVSGKGHRTEIPLSNIKAIRWAESEVAK